MVIAINRVLDYIEDNIDKEINTRVIGQIAYMSEYNFQKMFSILTDIPLGEYIRRRKLSRSLYEICETTHKIIDIAYQYGYESPDSFTKAFKNLFGMTPSTARQYPERLKSYPKLSVSIKIKGGTEVNYKVIEKEAFCVVGLKESYQDLEEGQKKISDFWDRFNASPDEEKLQKRMSAHQKLGFLGLCVPQEGTAYDYVIGVVTDEKEGEDPFECIEVPSSKWLVFEAKGTLPQSVQTTYKEIYESFFPSSQYKLASTPDFEFYPSGNVQSPDYITEIWIPIE